MARFENGWIKIYRKAILGDIYSDFARGGLFTVLVGIANIQNGMVSWRGKPRKLERGEIVTSVKELAELGNVDRRAVDRHLNYLCLRGTISVEKCPEGALITINNFDEYQSHDADSAKRHRNDMSNDLLNDSAHIEELKNKRRKEEADPLWALYEKLIQEYPIKVSKSRSGFRRFKEHVKNEADFAKVMLHLTHYRTNLKKNPWKPAKQTIDAWFGSEQKGYFWQQWESADIGDSKLSKAGSSGIVEE